MPDESSLIELLRQSLRGILTPRDAPTSPAAIGPFNQLELPSVPSPYPFRNPITPTKELDAAMRDLRSVAPGAGTNIREITQIPPRHILKYTANGTWGRPARADLHLDEYSHGYTPGERPGEADERGRVYVNPHAANQGSALAGQLARVATPSVQEQEQNDLARNIKTERAVTYRGAPAGVRSYAITPGDRQKTAEQQYESLLTALRSAALSSGKKQ